MQGVQVKIKLLYPIEKEYILKIKKGTSVKEFLKKINIKDIEEYSILLNGYPISTQERITKNSVIVIFPTTLGG